MPEDRDANLEDLLHGPPARDEIEPPVTTRPSHARHWSGRRAWTPPRPRPRSRRRCATISSSKRMAACAWPCP